MAGMLRLVLGPLVNTGRRHGHKPVDPAQERECRAPVKLITIPWWWHEMIGSHALGALDTLNNLVFGMASPPWAMSIVQPQTADLYATSPQVSLTRWHAQRRLLAVHSSRHHASLSH